MRILFIRDHIYAPDMVGGIERNTQALIRRLKSRGIAAAAVARLSRTGIPSLYNRILRKILSSALGIPDYFAGHATYRYWSPPQEIGAAVAAFRPDVLVVQAGASGEMVEVCLGFGLPVVWYVHGMDFRAPSQPVVPHERLTVLACGQFVADRVHAETAHRCDVVRPLIEPGDYRARRSGREVLFVNPRVEKGLDMAWLLAAGRPDIPFRFVEAWHVDAAMHADLVRRAGVGCRRRWAAAGCCCRWRLALARGSPRCPACGMSLAIIARCVMRLWHSRPGRNLRRMRSLTSLWRMLLAGWLRWTRGDWWLFEGGIEGCRCAYPSCTCCVCYLFSKKFKFRRALRHPFGFFERVESDFCCVGPGGMVLNGG